MLVLLLFGTGFVGYLPVPVLTAIVISALLGATEFHLGGAVMEDQPHRVLYLYRSLCRSIVFGNH